MNTFQRPAKESPLKRKPPRRRAAGESLLHALLEDISATFIMVGIVTAGSWSFAFEELWRHYFPYEPRPVTSVLLALLVTAGAILMTWIKVRKWKSIRQGWLGEVYVGQALEELKVSDFQILHDIPCVDSNIDHVLVGPKGIFTVETKTISKPTAGSKEIVYDGVTLQIPGTNLDRDPLVQARAQAAQITSILLEVTGRKVFVRPVVVFANWYIIQRKSGVDVWVLNETSLPKFIDCEPIRLNSDDIALFSTRLREYAQAHST